jgi:chromosome segregation ATPase
MVNKMSRTSITRQDVFEAAQGLIAKGYTPTQDGVRHFLGRGSRGTIHKYLKEWKEACFKQGGKKPKPEIEDTKKLLEENKRLEQQSSKQLEQNKILSHDLLIAERELAKVKEQCENQTEEINLLQEKHAVLEKEHEQILIAYEAMCQERETAIEKVLADKNQLIEALRAELQETHKENLEQARNWSYQQDETLMQEKVKSLNFQEQVKTLKEELKQTTLKLEKAKNIVEPLKREASRQKKIIEEHVDFNVLIKRELGQDGQGGGV